MLKLEGVSKTAVLTLRARADEHRREDRLFEDAAAVEWLAKLEWPIELDLWYSAQVQSFLAFRADEIDRYTRAVLARLPDACVVELGAGLSSRFLRTPVGPAGRWIDLDLPEVIAARRSLGVGGPRHELLAASVLDRAWFEQIGAVAPERLLLLAEGLFYYLPRGEVDALFGDLRRRFAGATIAFDVLGAADFETTRARSRAAGTPVEWVVEPPFERALADFGLAPIPGSEPDAVVEELIDRYWVRFGPATHNTVRMFSRIPSFRGQRSGVVLGTLLPL